MVDPYDESIGRDKTFTPIGRQEQEFRKEIREDINELREEFQALVSLLAARDRVTQIPPTS